jgi:protein phosphatase 1L
LNHGKPDAPETHFFGLFDGHAGGKCSQHVAGNLPSVLTEDEFFISNLPQAIKRSFHTVNEQFLKIAEKMKLHDGSTGLCALIRDNKILVANAGDCRALLVSSGRPIPLSNDHKPTSPDEQKRIAALGGSIVYCMGVARVNRVLAVSRAFGNRTLRSVIRPDAELMQRELVEGDDFLVMASDGLWDVLKNKDVCDVCYSPFLQRKPQQIADELVHLALARGSMDNVTCIVVNLNEFRNKGNTNEETRQLSFSENNNAHQGNLHRTQDIYVSRQHGIATDNDDNDTVDFSHGNNNHSQFASQNTPTKRGGVGKYPSNNNLLHDGLPKQYSLGNLRTGEENISNNEMAENIAMMKRSINSSQSNQKLLRGASTNSIPNIDSFPSMGNGVNSSNNQENVTGKLFTPVTGIEVMNRQLSGSAKLRTNAVSNLRNSVSNMRGSSNNNLDATQAISRASVNDLSVILNDFNSNNY